MQQLWPAQACQAGPALRVQAPRRPRRRVERRCRNRPGRRRGGRRAGQPLQKPGLLAHQAQRLARQRQLAPRALLLRCAPLRRLRHKGLRRGVGDGLSEGAQALLESDDLGLDLNLLGVRRSLRHERRRLVLAAVGHPARPAALRRRRHPRRRRDAGANRGGGRGGLAGLFARQVEGVRTISGGARAAALELCQPRHGPPAHF